MAYGYWDNGLPNCVPEYYRELFEERQHRLDMDEEESRYYADNKATLDAAGDDAISYPFLRCHGCVHFTSVGMTWYGDDYENGICALHGHCERSGRSDSEEYLDCYKKRAEYRPNR